MGNLEKKNKKIVRRTQIQEAIFLTLASGGRLGPDLIVRHVIGLLLGTEPHSPLRKSEVIKSAANRLKKKGLLMLEDGHYTLAPAGKVILERWQRADFKLAKPSKWDSKWRIVIFDIPEQKKSIREEIRQIFIQAGFRRLQDSVWVYPYDCEDLIGLLKTDFGVGRNMLYIIADQIENDKYLRDEFSLLH